MELKSIKKVRDSKYLKGYELNYINKSGKEKIYEIVSHNEIENPEDLGKKVSGISIVALHDNKLLLLKEYRMAVNSFVYNLCAGFIEKGESIEECIARELYEETGLRVKRIIKILNPSFAAVGITDVKNQIAFIEAEGSFEDHSSDNEDITASFYTKKEVENLLNEEEFSSRAQIVSYIFTKFDLESI